MTTIKIDDMIAKRREVLGEGDRFKIEFAEKEFWLKAPELSSADWNDQFSDFRTRGERGEFTNEQARDILVDLFIKEDEEEELLDLCDENGVDVALVIQWAVDQHAKEVLENPTRKSLRSSRKR